MRPDVGKKSRSEFPFFHTGFVQDVPLGAFSPFWNFYKAKQECRKADEQDAQLGQYVQLSSSFMHWNVVMGFMQLAANRSLTRFSFED